MAINQSRDDDLPADVNDFRSGGRRDFIARPDLDDPAFVDDERTFLDHRPCNSVNTSAAQDDRAFGIMRTIVCSARTCE